MPARIFITICTLLPQTIYRIRRLERRLRAWSEPRPASGVHDSPSSGLDRPAAGSRHHIPQRVRIGKILAALQRRSVLGRVANRRPLYRALPELRTAISREPGAGKRIEFPIALYGRSPRTFPGLWSFRFGRPGSLLIVDGHETPPIFDSHQSATNPLPVDPNKYLSQKAAFSSRSPVDGYRRFTAPSPYRACLDEGCSDTRTPLASSQHSATTSPARCCPNRIRHDLP